MAPPIWGIATPRHLLPGANPYEDAALADVASRLGLDVTDTSKIELRDRTGRVVGHAAVDPDDTDYLRAWTWRLSSHGYAVRNETTDGRKHTLYMHRVLMNPPPGLVVDHINRNPLDNRRSNLRIATVGENNANSKARPNRAGYRGVYPFGQSGRFVAQISVGGKVQSLGLHDTPEDAARAYDRAAHQARPDFACPNFAADDGPPTNFGSRHGKMPRTSSP